MQIQLEPADQGNAIVSHRPGEVQIGAQRLRNSLIVSRDALISDWRPAPLERWTGADLAAAVAMQPEILVLGTGLAQRFPPPRLVADLAMQGIGLEVMDNGAACRTYNLLLSEQRAVVLALLF